MRGMRSWLRPWGHPRSIAALSALGGVSRAPRTPRGWRRLGSGAALAAHVSAPSPPRGIRLGPSLPGL
eukprot:6775046-Lingulodinium_polyedra.AAC.1